MGMNFRHPSEGAWVILEELVEQLLLWDMNPGCFPCGCLSMFFFGIVDPGIVVLDQTKGGAMGWSSVSAPWGISLWDCHGILAAQLGGWGRTEFPDEDAKSSQRDFQRDFQILSLQ